MNKITKFIIGIAITALGVIYALNALEIADINIFFEGWWTFLIIIPCVVGLVSGKDRTASIIGILFGVALFLSCRGIIEFRMIYKLIIPVIIIILGLRIAFDGFIDKNGKEVSDKVKENSKPLREFKAIFSSNNVDLSGQQFDGAILTSVFGSLDFNVSNSVITGDTVIRVTSLFGSADIHVPEGVNVRMSANSVFGDTKNSKCSEYPGAPVVYVKCVCVFGGVHLK